MLTQQQGWKDAQLDSDSIANEQAIRQYRGCFVKMWLLNTATFELHYSVSETDQKYAILSHTWGDEEVLFQDMKTNAAREKKGWEKITSACRKASEDYYLYLWIDTVCINKESSAELSEAINSMWLYYHNANVCYVHLSDVGWGCPRLRPDGDWENGHWEKTFTDARWFSRGWTLQELIAPRNVTFCNRAWKTIGTKLALHQPLSRITGIDELVLVDSGLLPSYTIAKRMSWAAHRSTTREEDRAYSLLGIFDIRMPLIYGERQNAFTRLQDEIIKNSTDHSIFAWERGAEDQRDLMFATGPHQFAHATRVVPRRGTWIPVDLPYRLNNRGIQFDGLCVFQSSRYWYAALNCRYEDDLTGPIALRICRRDESSRKSDARIEENDFWVDASSNDTNGFISRTVVADRNETLISTTHVTLLRYHPAYEPWRIVSSFPKIWLCREASSVDIEIIEAYPKHQWNTRTGVMCPTAASTVTSVRLRDELGNSFIIGFKLAVEDVVLEQLDDFGRMQTDRDTKFSMLMDWSATVTSCELAAEHMAHASWHSKIEVTTSINGVWYCARVGRATRMGDLVYVIEISKKT